MWNYRICKYTVTPNEEVAFEVREAYYNDDGSIYAITDEAIGIYGGSIEDIQQSYDWMAEAFKKDIIDLDTFVFTPHKAVVDEDWTDVDENEFNNLMKDIE